KGQVDISLLTRDDRAIIKIEDTGVGIAEEDRKNLFHKFSRGKKATDMYTDGSGLGLFIAQKIVTGHPQGEIDFSSQVGRGTIFEISLAK
ncbi:MAG TPA: ATP-binding protein, partial [Candidatus Vogelbacteria bacterium]|nr:ATP-binding protein [Candidatus Vogelbacteria bacterium]